MLTKRQIAIIKILMKKTSFTTIYEISKLCSLSEKTIQNELVVIQDILSLHHFGELHKIRGKGVLIDIYANKKEQLVHELSINEEVELNLLIKKLFFSNKSIIWTEKSLCEQLSLSRGQLHKKIIELSAFCKQNNIVIQNVQNYGIMIQGNEFQIRDSVIALFLEQSNYPLELTSMGKILDQKQSERFQQIFQGFVKHPLETMLLDLEQKNHIYLDHISRINVFLHICICIMRTILQYNVSLTEEQLSFIPYKNNNDQLLDIYDTIESNYHIKLPLNEKYYIQLYLDSYGLMTKGGFENAKNALRSSLEFQQFLLQFIEVLNTILNIDIHNETSTLQGLITHVSGTVIRLKNQIKIHNPLLANVKKSFSLIYQATWSTSILFDQYFHITITEDEIAYIALYLGVVREKTDYHLTICLVIARTNNLTMILKEQIIKLHHAIQIDAILTPNEYHMLKNMHTWDLVITTIDDLDGNTSVHVNEIMTNEEKAYIQSLINHIADKKILRSETSFLLNRNQLFDEHLIFIKPTVKTKEELLTFICDKLTSYGYTTPDFLASVLKREREISTEIGSGVAIPHGNALFVRKTIIAYISLPAPIEWVPNENVQHIFLPAINSNNKKEVEDSIKKFYKTLISLIENNQIHTLLEKNNPSDIINIIESN